MDRRKYKRMRRRLVLLTTVRYFAMIAAGALIWFGSKYIASRSAEEVADVKDREESKYYITVDDEVRMTVVDDTGVMSMEITGESVRLSNDQKEAVFEGASATYYKDNQPEIWMEAGQIAYNTDTEDFLITETPGENDLWVETRDGMRVEAPEVDWVARLTPPAPNSNEAKVPSFRFPKGVRVMQEKSKGRNTIEARYMQGDKDLMYMEFVGDVQGTLSELKDTEFITERELTNVNELNLDDFETLAFRAEKVIYDKNREIVTATSSFHDKPFTVIDLDGREVHAEDFQDSSFPVTFSKEEITIQCAHLEAHVDEQWAHCIGNIDILVPPDDPEEGDDPALKSVKQYETHIQTDDVEYFWGRDYILTHRRTRVIQEDRLALSDRITYWGDNKMVLLDGNITMVQGSGQWLVDDELITVEDHDMERAVTAYTEMYSDRAVVYLDNNDFIASGAVRVFQDEREVAADTIVYQDEIKRISAKGNIKFLDKDGQTLLCNSLVYHNDSDFMQVEGGASASLRLPAKYANDINRALADMREKTAPPDIEDPEVSQTPPSRNPNSAVGMSGLKPLDVPEAPDEDAPEGTLQLPPGNGQLRDSTETTAGEPQGDFIVDVGATSDGEGEAAETPEPEPRPDGEGTEQ